MGLTGGVSLGFFKFVFISLRRVKLKIIVTIKQLNRMAELRDSLNQKIAQGKNALMEKDFDLAIHSFEKAAQIASEAVPSLNSIIGISHAYIALAFGRKGNSEAALENVNTANEFFPENPINPIAFASVLTQIGIDFQKIDLFVCSIIILKKALKMARQQTAEVDLEPISTIARTLAISYSKIGNNTSSGKLFRIAADLEDDHQIAIDLYLNSAYFYYQDGMKEFSLNILQTVFDKTGILGDEKKQTQIARYQGFISHEIALNYLQRGYLSQAIAYNELCFDKFSFIKNTHLTVKVLYEQAMILESMGKRWKRNNVLRKIIEYEIKEQTEEYIVKAILLLTIHALEGKQYSEAAYFIQQISNSQMEELNQKLVQKIQEVQEILKLSLQREQIHTNLQFSLKDLALPVEEIIEEPKVLSQEIRIQEEGLELQAPKLNITIHESSPLSSDLKRPSIETLQELFDSSEEPPIIPEQEPHSVITEDQLLTGRTQELKVSNVPDSVIRESQEKTMALERLFRAHQEPREHLTPLSPITSELSVEARDFEPPLPDQIGMEPIEEVSQVPAPSPQIVPQENIRALVVGRLQKAGWAVELNFDNFTQKGAEPDIIAEKGLIRKHRLLIFFAENPTDAEICSFLLQSNLEGGKKIIYLLDGNPGEADVSKEIKLVTQINQLF